MQVVTSRFLQSSDVILGLVPRICVVPATVVCLEAKPQNGGSNQTLGTNPSMTEGELGTGRLREAA